MDNHIFVVFLVKVVFDSKTFTISGKLVNENIWDSSKNHKIWKGFWKIFTLKLMNRKQNINLNIYVIFSYYFHYFFFSPHLFFTRDLVGKKKNFFLLRGFKLRGICGGIFRENFWWKIQEFENSRLTFWLRNWHF